MTTNPIRRLGDSTFVKLTVLGLLVLLMIIPVVQVTGLVRERMGRQHSVEAEISGIWGGSQSLLGPILTVPFTTQEEQVTVKQTESRSNAETVERTRRTLHHDLRILPTEIHWVGKIEPQIRYRGLFQVVVYEARLEARGTFELPSFSAEQSPQWDSALLNLGVSDVRGLQERIQLTWGNEEHSFLPGMTGLESLGGGIHVPLPDISPGPEGERIPFRFDLVLRGSRELLFLPAGEETQVELASTWTDPGFIGAFLPSEREVGEKGFTARWQVPFFGRSFAQSWVGQAIECPQLKSSTFGVSLILPADAYQQTERSVKYAILFILMTFGTFFLLELLSPVRLHAMQYLLVGFALVLFYVLLLALAEHLGFGLSYVLAATATATLISAYTRSILMSGRWALLLLACLGTLYGYLFVLLRLEDFALLLGAVGLFAALAIVMRLTRNLDWYSLSFRPQGTTTEQALS